MKIWELWNSIMGHIIKHNIHLLSENRKSVSSKNKTWQNGPHLLHFCVHS